MVILSSKQHARTAVPTVVRTAGGRVPHELVVFPPGWGDATRAASGEGPWLVDETAANSIIKSFAHLGHDLVIDYEHATIFPEERADGTAPAAGWITALRWEPERGIVATVEWTEKAAELIRKHEYRFFSPVFTKEPRTNRVRELMHVALTNDPATLNIEPIAAGRRLVRSGRVVRVGAPRDLITTKGAQEMPLPGSTTGLEGVVSALNEAGASIEPERLDMNEVAPIVQKLDGAGRNLLAALFNAVERPDLEGAAAAARRNLSFGQHSYLRALDACVGARGVSRLEAIRLVKREQPALYRAYTGRNP